MKTRWICLGVLLLALLLLLCACGESKESFGDSAVNKSGAAFGSTAEYGSEPTDPGSAMPPKIIRTADVNAETKAYDDAMTLLRGKIAAVGGYISDADTYAGDGDGGRTAHITVRVPAEKLDEFLAYVEDNVHVTSSSVSSNDVSARYYDIEARLATLRAEKAALDDMLEHAATTAEALAIRAQLTDVTQNIESYEAQIRLYDDRISYSTVTIRLYEVVVYSPESETFGARVGNAFGESWRAFRTFWINVVLFFVYALPFILVLLVICGAILAVIFLRRKRQNNAAAPEKPDEDHKT